MLVVISPAKTLDFETPAKTKQSSQPDFLDASECLIEQLRELNPADISALMKISDKLGQLNFARFHDWQQPFTADNAKQALLAFKGDVYTGLDAESFKADDFKFAQKHLRILSGLYGLLRPLDLIQPYRLEMGTKFENSAGKNLYAFWDETITGAVNAQLKKLKSETLVNLASNEYFKAIKPKQLTAEVVTPVFKDLKAGKYKIISFYAKKARGLMSAYIIKNRLTDAEQLKAFDCEGYRYNPAMSTAHEPTFIRDHAE
jgi:cytoplasmic iron level regulating protein YaaA (DUF328/UPF0246 family)